MFIFDNIPLLLISALAVAFVVTCGVIPIIIDVDIAKGLVDKPDNRTSYSSLISTLGGLAIFFGFILSLSLFTNFKVSPSL